MTQNENRKRKTRKVLKTYIYIYKKKGTNERGYRIILVQFEGIIFPTVKTLPCGGRNRREPEGRREKQRR